MIKETVISKTNKKLWFCGKKMKQYSGFNPKNDNIYMAYVKKFKKLKKNMNVLQQITNLILMTLTMLQSCHIPILIF